MDQLIQTILSEVALEGYEGCTFEELCRAVDVCGCYGWTPLADDTKDYLLKLLVTENPGGYLTFYEKSAKPGTKANAKYCIREYGRVFLPIDSHVSDEGSLFDVNRIKLKHAGLSELIKNKQFVKKLILVASRDFRMKRLTGHCISADDLGYFELRILEAVARTRKDGLPKRFVSLLSGKQNRNVHHYIRSLIEKDLVSMRQVAKQRQLYLPCYATGLQDDTWYMKIVSSCMEERGCLEYKDPPNCIDVNILRNDFGRVIMYNSKRAQALNTSAALTQAQDNCESTRSIQKIFRKTMAKLETAGYTRQFVVMNERNKQVRWVQQLKAYTDESGSALKKEGEFAVPGGVGNSELTEDSSPLRQIYEWIDMAGADGLPQAAILERTGLSAKWVERAVGQLQENYGVGLVFAQNLTCTLISPRYANEGQNKADVERRSGQKVHHPRVSAHLAIEAPVMESDPIQCAACKVAFKNTDEKVSCSVCHGMIVCQRCFEYNEAVHDGSLSHAGVVHLSDHIMLCPSPMARKFIRMRLDINLGGTMGEGLDSISDLLKTNEAFWAAGEIRKIFPDMQRYQLYRLVSMAHAQRRGIASCIAVRLNNTLRKCLILRRLNADLDTQRVRNIIKEYTANASLPQTLTIIPKKYPLLQIGDLQYESFNFQAKQEKSWLNHYVSANMGRAKLMHSYLWKLLFGQIAVEIRADALRQEALTTQASETALLSYSTPQASQRNILAADAAQKTFKKRNRKRTKVPLSGDSDQDDDCIVDFTDPYSNWPPEFSWLIPSHEVCVEMWCNAETNTEIGQGGTTDLTLQQVVDNFPIHLFCEVVGVWREVEGLYDILSDPQLRLNPFGSLPETIRLAISPFATHNRDVMARLIGVLDTLKTMKLVEIPEATEETIAPSGLSQRTNFTTRPLSTENRSVNSRFSKLNYDVFRMCITTSLEVPILPSSSKREVMSVEEPVDSNTFTTIFKFSSLGRLYEYWRTLHNLSEQSIRETEESHAANRQLFKVVSVGGLPLSLRLNIPGDINPWKGHVNLNYEQQSELRAILRKYKVNRPGWATEKFHLGYAWGQLVSEWDVYTHLKRVLAKHQSKGSLPISCGLESLPEVVKAFVVKRSKRGVKKRKRRKRLSDDEERPSWKRNKTTLRARASMRRGRRKRAVPADNGEIEDDGYLTDTSIRLNNSRIDEAELFDARTLQKSDDRVFTWAENEFIVLCNTARRLAGLRRGTTAFYEILRLAFILNGFDYPDSGCKKLREQSVYLDSLGSVRHVENLVIRRVKHVVQSGLKTLCIDALNGSDGVKLLEAVKTLRQAAHSTGLMRTMTRSYVHGLEGWAFPYISPSVTIHSRKRNNAWLNMMDIIKVEAEYTGTTTMKRFPIGPIRSLHSDLDSLAVVLVGQMLIWTKLAQDSKTVEDAPYCNLPAYWLQHCLDSFEIVRKIYMPVSDGLKSHGVTNFQNGLSQTSAKLVKTVLKPEFFSLIKLTTESLFDVGTLSMNLSNTRMGEGPSGFSAALFSHVDDILHGRATISVQELSEMTQDGDTHYIGDFNNHSEAQGGGKTMPLRCSVVLVAPDLSQTHAEVAQRAFKAVPSVIKGWTRIAEENEDDSGGPCRPGNAMCNHEHDLQFICESAGPNGVSEETIRATIAACMKLNSGKILDKDIDLSIHTIVDRGVLLRVGIVHPTYVLPAHAGLWATMPVSHIDNSREEIVQRPPNDTHTVNNNDHNTSTMGEQVQGTMDDNLPMNRTVDVTGGSSTNHDAQTNSGALVEAKSVHNPPDFQVDDSLVRVIEPWVVPSINGCIDWDRLHKILILLLELVLKFPGVKEEMIFEHVLFFLLPRSLTDLLDLLVAGRVLERRHLPVVCKPDLFSSPMDTLLLNSGTKYKNTTHNTSSIYYATTECYVRLAFMVDQRLG
eukprot:CFRG5478T1